MSASTKKKPQILTCAFFLSSLTLLNINPAFAQPIIPAKDGTNTIVNLQGNRFDITGGQRSSDGANLFHSFTRFGIDNQQIANFLSQPNIRNILARVNGGEISYINGLIQITGGNSNLFLMNPSGVVFGGNARLNVPAAFTATTANSIGFGNNWFNTTGNNNYPTLVGDPNAFAFTMPQPGVIINSGDLAVGLGQNLNLLAGAVINTGTLTAPQGNITVTAVPGNSLVRLSQPGFLLSLEIQPIGNTVTQPNSFDFPIASLPQMLTGGNGGNATGITVNPDGSVELTGSGISIPTAGNTAIVSGKIDASGETGGNINILGDKIGVINANINASGTKDGGNVRIGGDYKGQGNLPTASRVLINNDTIINVDSSTAGNGGKVIIWSDKATAFNGKISAKGGNNSGDGGFVEVSSADVLIFNGDVDTSAPNGKTGTLLLDPSFLNILDTLTAGSGTQDANLTKDNEILAGDLDLDGFPGKNTLTWKAIASLGSGANVVLEATGDITIENIVGGTFGVTIPDLVDLKLDTGSLRITSTNGGVIFKDTSDQIRTQGGAITVQALGGQLTGGIFNTTGTAGDKAGNVNLEAKAELQISKVITGGGSINLTSGGKMITNFLKAFSGTGNGGNITVKSDDAINLGLTNSSSINGKGGNINVTAKQDVVLNSIGDNLVSDGTNGGGDITIISTNGAIIRSGAGYGNILAKGGSGVGGNVSLKAFSQIDLSAIDTFGEAGRGNILITGNEINFGDSVRGGVVTLEPSPTTEAIRIAGDETDNTAVLDISPNDLNNLIDIDQLIIGSTQGSGDITVDAAGATFNNSVTIQSGTGNIKANGELAAFNKGKITLITGGNITTKNITATEEIKITSAGGNIDTSGGKLDTSNQVETGSIFLNATGNITTGDIITANFGSGDAGDVSLISSGGIINTTGGKIDTTTTGNAGGSVLLNSPVNIIPGDIVTKGVTAGGDVDFNGKVNLNKDVKIDTGAGVSGDINFTGKVDGTQTLTLEAGTGTIRFNAVVGETTPLGKLDITSAGNIELAGSIITNNSDINFNTPVTVLGGSILNAGTATINVNKQLVAGSNQLTFAADEINFNGGAASVSGTNKLILQPATSNLDINIGGSSEQTITPALDLTFSDINALTNGFSSIVIGRENSSGTISIVGNVSFNDPVIIQSPNGQIIVNAAITGTDDASINLSGKSNLNADITTIDRDINLKGSVILGKNVTLSTDVTAGGNISVDGTIDGNQKLTLETGTGDINLNGAVGSSIPLNDFLINSAKNITAKSITAASITQKVGTGVTTLGDLNTNSASGINLIGNSFGFNGKVTTTNNGGFTISNASPLTLDAAIFNLDGAFKQIGEGAVSLAGKLTTTNDEISFKSAVTLIGDTVLDTGAGMGDITFNSTVDGKANLTLNAGIGQINFGGAVGSNQRIGDLIIDSATDVNAKSITAASITQKLVTGVTNLGALDTNSPQGINLNSNFINLNGAVITTNNGGLTINNSGVFNIKSDINLDGAFNQIGTGEVLALGSITNTNDDIRFNSFITLMGETKFNPGTGAIAFNSGLFAGTNSLTLRAGEVIFGGKVTGSGNLILEPADPNQTVAIADTIPGAFNLSASTLANLENGFNSITIGRIDGTGLVSVKEVSFNDPITIRAGSGTINVNGAIIGKDNASITLDAALLNLNANLTNDNQNITLGRVIQLGNDVTISTGLGAGDITFNGSVDGTKQLNLVAGSGNIRFNAAVGKNAPLSKLDVSTNSNVFVSQGINTTSELTINAPVILTENAVFSAGNGNITFGNTVDSELGEANNLTLSAVTGNVTFNGAVGSSQELGNILIINAKDLTANSTIQAQQLQLKAGTGNVNLKGNIITSGAGVELNTTGDIRTSNITAKGGNISANSQNGIVETGNLDASNTGIEGTITLISPKAITTGNLTATGVEKGGTVIVKSGDRITTANINVSATIGDGGTVFIDPPNDVQVGFINAQGGSQGIGGKVDITTESLFRSTATFIDNKGVNSSISTTSGMGNGSIIIRHGGGSLKTPFIVGDASKNGTAGALTTGADTITPLQSFIGSYTLGNIQIITKDFSGNVIINEIVQVIQQQQNISDLPGIPITQVPPVLIDSILRVTEENFSQEFTAYLGLTVNNNIKTLEEIKAQLRRNEEETGVRSAIFYIIFSRGQQEGETLVNCPPDSGTRVQNNGLQAENCQAKDSDRVELFLITPEGEPISFPISNATKEQIIALAKQLQMEVTDRSKLDTTSYLPPAQELYKLLIAPIEDKLQERGIKNLIFIPDAGLRSLPLAALHDGNGFIIERYSVSLMPSFSLTNPRFYNLKNSTVLAMGASTFKEQSPLPAVPIELSTIASQLWSGKISLNEAFTINNLNTQRNTGNFEIVHLATHAEFRPGTPSNSYIQFWDERLGLDQVRNVKWNAPPVQLLVLSACRTALGDRQVELGFAGLAIQAGVQSALASLWYVSDQGTLALMTEFYEQLKTAPIRAEALRRAQIAMIKGEIIINNNELEGIGEAGISLPPELRQPGKVNFSHPYYWSGFTLIGNPW